MSAQISLSPRIRKSPFYEATLHEGALGFSVYNKMYLPIGYDDPETEFWALVNDVTLWDVAVQRIVEITGPDAFIFTNMLTPRDLTKCKIGSCKYVLITDDYGGILNDPVLLRLAENHFWLSRADSDLLMWAKGVAVFAGLDVDIREPDVAALQLQGPKSIDVVSKLFDPKAQDLIYYDFMETTLLGSPVILARTGWSAERGYEIYVRDTSQAQLIWMAIMEAGQEFNISPIAPNRIRRIEGGILDYGVDMTDATNPFEIGMDRLVHLNCEQEFIGEKALRKIKSVGISRRLVGVFVDGEALDYNETAWPAYSDDGEIGKLTSVVYSPRLKANIGYVMADIQYSEIGTEFFIETTSGRRKARIVQMPFYDPKKDLSRT